MTSLGVINAEFPDKLKCLFTPSRYKVLYGGRGGAKSWGIARALLIQAVQSPTRVLCVREFMISIRESVHRLLSDQIEALGLAEFFEIQQTSIKGRNGSEFFFEGIRNNATRLKSYEGVSIAWVEEAQSVTKTSWDILIPTIRKDNSEIWISFNPELEEDETYQRFVVNPPHNAIVQKINWSDNPFFPSVLFTEMEDLKRRDKDSWLNVWQGEPKQILEGAVYAKEMRDAMEHDRITKVPYNPGKSVETYWDLGWADATCIWFVQAVGFEYHVIDYLQDSQNSITHYIKELQKKPYIYGADFLPHDAKSKSLGTGRSIEEIMRASGRTVRIVPKLSLYDGINAARTIFPQCYFDREKCADGLHSLRHYRYEVVPGTKMFGKNPLHDWASHGADGFRYMAIAMRDRAPKSRLDRAKEKRQNTPYVGTSENWMGN